MGQQLARGRKLGDKAYPIIFDPVQSDPVYGWGQVLYLESSALKPQPNSLAYFAG